MNIPFNLDIPSVMHIDLNSCFATAEQQAYPNLRGKPLVIAAYTHSTGCILAPSIEAKRWGIKTGMSVREAYRICPSVIVRDPDVGLIRDVHRKFKYVLKHYAVSVTPKSIDELVLDFTGSHALERSLVDVGREIKKRIRLDIGEWISCNVGISTNRFLAKLAASLHKPDGLDVITEENAAKVYESLSLTDLPGINKGYAGRLQSCGIYSPSAFFQATSEVLEHQVFKSICGNQWYMRLRGWEVDISEAKRKSFGQSYALQEQTDDPKKIARLTMKLCEKMGRRLRKGGYCARGLRVDCLYTDVSSWHLGKTFATSLYTTRDLFEYTLILLNEQPVRKILRNLSICCFDLTPIAVYQQSLFQDVENKKLTVQKAMDSINDTWGEFSVTTARMMGMKNIILDRISFGNVRDLEELYA